MNRLLAFALYFALITGAVAQTSPNLVTGQVLTAAQWNQLFINKQDTLGYTPLNTAGGVMTGRLVLGQVQSGASLSDFNIPPGVVPAAPANGDLWTTTSGIFAQINGVTYNLISSGSLCPTCALTNQVNTFTFEQIIDLGTGTEPSSDIGTTWAAFAADTTVSRFEATAFGASAAFSGRASGGTRASPTAVTSSTLLAAFNAHGYDASSWTGNPGAAIHMYAEGSTWTSSSHPGEVCLATTPTGSNTGPADSLCQHQDGGITIGSPTAGNKGAGTIDVNGIYGSTVALGGATIGSNALAVTGTTFLNSNSALAFTVGPNGTTNPSFLVNASAGSAATGVQVVSNAAGSGASLSTISSGTNESLAINAKGSGSIFIGGVSTGQVQIGAAGSNVSIGATSGAVTIGGNTITFPTSAATLAALNLQNQNVTGGATVTSQSISSGSFTVNCGLGPEQFITGPTSAWTITAPSSDGSCLILLTQPGSSAQIPTFSGFTVGSNTGSSITAVASTKFTISVWRVNGVSGYSIFAHQ